MAIPFFFLRDLFFMVLGPERDAVWILRGKKNGMICKGCGTSIIDIGVSHKSGLQTMEGRGIVIV